jgi:hypothetical protein
VKKHFLGMNTKNFVSKAITLTIIGFVIATTFIAVSTSFAKNLNAANKQVLSGSVGPGFNQDSACQVNTDSLSSTSPFRLQAGNAPSCDRVDWVFPTAVTASRNCTFTLDSNFEGGLTIDFYYFRDGAPSDHGNPNPVTSASTPGTLSVQGSHIGLAHLNTADEALAGRSVTLGYISYTCNSVKSPFFSQFEGPVSGSVSPALTRNSNCPQFTDSLTNNGGTSWTLKVDGDATCDFVTWTFPSNIANQICTFKADGTFSDNLQVGFYSSVSPTGGHPFDSAVDTAVAANGGTFLFRGTTIVQSYLITSSVRVGSTTLGNISYYCG